MKTLILVGLGLLSFIAHGQKSVKSAEYFFDTDPGLGKGTIITLNSNMGTLDQKMVIPTASLTPGFHSLYIRTRDAKDENGKSQWSLYDRASFYKIAFAKAKRIAKGEYYFDENDPGIGSAIPLSVNTNTGSLQQDFNIPISILGKGFHVLNVRFQDDNEKWSLYDRTTFYINRFVENPDIKEIEYFVDSDPGIGLGLPSNFTETENGQMFDAPLESFTLANGDHIFYVRVKNSNGDWSIYDSQAFTVDGTLGIEDNLRKSLLVYPNPFKDKINLGSGELQFESISIYDILGKTVYSDTNPPTIIDLSNLKSGVYIMNLKTDKGRASYRIIKN